MGSKRTAALGRDRGKPPDFCAHEIRPDKQRLSQNIKAGGSLCIADPVAPATGITNGSRNESGNCYERKKIVLVVSVGRCHEPQHPLKTAGCAVGSRSRRITGMEYNRHTPTG